MGIKNISIPNNFLFRKKEVAKKNIKYYEKRKIIKTKTIKTVPAKQAS